MQSPWWTQFMYVVSGIVFLLLGLMAYWENHDPNGALLQSRWFSIGGIFSVMILSIMLVNSFTRWLAAKQP